MRVEISDGDLAKVRSMLRDVRGGADLAIARALNKGISHGKTQAVKAIGQYLTLKAARIKQDFTVRKAKKSDTSGAIIATGRPVGLLNFMARPRKDGYSVKVKRRGPREVLKHAFRASTTNVKNGGGTYTTEHLWWRQYSGSRSQGPPMPPGFYARLPERFRHPLQRLEGPRIEDIFDKPGIIDPIMKAASDKTSLHLDTEVERILKKHA